jgi:hypothetical protein
MSSRHKPEQREIVDQLRRSMNDDVTPPMAARVVSLK